jgi:hypothetical protein
LEVGYFSLIDKLQNYALKVMDEGKLEQCRKAIALIERIENLKYIKIK